MAEAAGELFQAKKVKGCWENPWEPWQQPGLWAFMRWLLREKDNKNIPLNNEKELSETLPVQTPEFDRLLEKSPDGLQVMWIGHASLLVQFDGISILTDPIFSDRCSPVSEYLPIGPKRYRPPPCGVSDLPGIDIVVISHNHYDHLDLPTVRHLNERFGSGLRWYVPMDMRSWFLDVGCQNVIELVWWQEDMASINKNDFKFVCTPCQHWCRRGVNDYNKALWCSWVIKGPQNSFFFAGDTGYQSQVFKQIGQKYGPFSIAAIPIGNYEPSSIVPHPYQILNIVSLYTCRCCVSSWFMVQPMG
ncbi:hypothetical protein CHS0354_009373 [Potamilus streckersoni]|uniref:N-acetylphosphatidylethanolamine-hydrolyzing phospholipase D n=1 Tax=Potamilus streckersoni TaxID=2493646 RepID=A0AAE0W7U5_9BIVA|nr:hypothetical protein CHS0354_009373 [Potamilus streckersoni]